MEVPPRGFLDWLYQKQIRLYSKKNNSASKKVVTNLTCQLPFENEFLVIRPLKDHCAAEFIKQDPKFGFP